LDLQEQIIEAGIDDSQKDLLALATVNDKTKKGGGIRAYADEIGRGESSIMQWTAAASVYGVLSEMSTTNALNEKTSHLYEISKAPQATWQVLADLLVRWRWNCV
jgi:hypothetical protein